MPTKISDAAKAAGEKLKMELRGPAEKWCNMFGHHRKNIDEFHQFVGDSMNSCAFIIGEQAPEIIQSAIDTETQALRTECQDWQDELTGARTRIAQLETQNSALVEALKIALPWLYECESVDEMGMPEQNPPLENSIELIEGVLKSAGVE